MLKIFWIVVAMVATTIKAENLPLPKLDLGQKVTFDGTKQEVYVRLPQGYHQSKRSYPVVYLLDADLFYLKDMFFHSIALIDRLASAVESGDIPQLIVVGIPFGSQQSWYQKTQSEPHDLRQFISQTLPQKIKQHYRTLDNKILVGQSYSGAFVIDLLARQPNVFDTIVAIDAIFPNQSQFDKAAAEFAQLSNSKTRLLNAQSVAPNAEIERLLKHLPNPQALPLTQRVYPNESHVSVYYAALNDGLRQHFADYRAPSKTLLSQQTFDDAAIKNYFAQSDKKYQRHTSAKQVASAAKSIAHYYLTQQRFELAFALYDKYADEGYYKYILNRFAQQSYNQQDYSSATLLWQKMLKRFGQNAEAQQGLEKARKHL